LTGRSLTVAVLKDGAGCRTAISHGHRLETYAALLTRWLSRAANQGGSHWLDQECVL